jgi:hypothetical protein
LKALLGLGKEEVRVEYALFTLMWLAVALLATLGARIALRVLVDLREKLGKH